MLRPASDALIRQKAATTTTVVVLAFALLVPCLAVLAATFADAAASDYLAAYRPVVYLEADADQAAAESLADTINAWSQVDQAVLRSPEQALDALEERLGADEVAKLG
ncbi:MAG: permease-like cell division protein FtsX, partial [Persicimonas sp.]